MNDFDLSKFYTARITSTQLRGMLATLRRLDEYVKKHARRKLLATVLGSLAFIGLAIFLGVTNEPLFAVAGPLSLLGLSFVYITSLVQNIFVPKPGSSIGTSIALLVFPGILLYGFTFTAMGANSDAFGDRHYAIEGALVSTLFVAFCFFVSSGVSWGALAAQPVEMDYLEKVALPLFADLPKNTRGDLVFNPFGGEWSRIPLPTPSRSGYTYEAFSDIILRLRLPLDDHRDLKLSVIEQTLSKTKNRKGKYKGTKHRLVVRYDMQLAPGAELDAGVVVEQALAEGKLEVPSTVTVDKGRITVVQVKKSADFERGLKETHLVAPLQIMTTIRAMSAASIAKSA